jgi:hypothetical protein
MRCRIPIISVVCIAKTPRFAIACESSGECECAFTRFHRIFQALKMQRRQAFYQKSGGGVCDTAAGPEF